MLFFNHIMGATKFKVYFKNFSEVLTRAVCGVTVSLGIKMESSRIFPKFILLLQGLFY